MTTYVLPPLGYDHAALEPHVSARLLELHHGKHHAAYVDKANQALERLAEARAQQSYDAIGPLERQLAFHLSGHILHSIFWQNLSPHGGGEPTGELQEQIEQDFGGFDPFRRQMIAAAEQIMGSGWSALVWEPLGRRLVTTQIYDHQSNLTQGSVPLLVIDAWEHAYYLQYENRKQEFFQAVWNVFDWDDVARRFDAARSRDVGIASATQ
jgi:Fe-Mn family superoxide dismutase